jgi:nucleotide-binding universal stress UspA family protein
MTTITAADRRPALGIGASKTSPVVIATDGKAQSDGALVLGNLLAGSDDARRVVSVLRASPVVPDATAAINPDIDRIRRADLHAAAVEQTTRQFGAPVEVDMYDGDPAAVVARLAHRAGASLIVCGLGRHSVVDRILGDETALRLVRLADVPVLAVAEAAGGAPTSIVVACDFSETSLRAARLAAALAAPGATIYLVHVAPRRSSDERDAWGRGYDEDARDALARTRKQLRCEDKTIVQPVILDGETVPELLRFAHDVHADLIATGSHGHGFITRMLVGSVATRLVRASRRSILTVPHAAALTDARTAVVPPLGRSVPRDDWDMALFELTTRNAGRRTLLEVDDAEIGAQAQEFDYQFRGAAFDHNDGRLTLMFGGDDFGDGHHLTRGIARPTALDVLTERGGRDLAVRIAHGKGQTLLTFVE